MLKASEPGDAVVPVAGAKKAGDSGDAVALKFMSDRLAFDREVLTYTPHYPSCIRNTPPMNPYHTHDIRLMQP